MLEWHPNTQALADAFAENVEDGLRGDVDEEVEASAGKTDSKDAGYEIGCDNVKQNLTKIIFQNTVKTRNEAKELLKNKGYIGKTILNKKNKSFQQK